ncbi:hypothetical protein, partial [Rheinheimera sp. SA_1]|uniref:hypothetical protein n=1 Tax=Rheinheimera sp. SA_1 TaxID=1827365 RepID=UPI001E5BBBA2
DLQFTWFGHDVILTVKKSFGFKFGCKKVNVKFLWKLVGVWFSLLGKLVDVRFSGFLGNWWMSGFLVTLCLLEICGCPVFCVLFFSHVFWKLVDVRFSRFSVLTACAQTRIHVLITVVSIFRDL